MLDLGLKEMKGMILIFSYYFSKSPCVDYLVSLGLGQF